MKLSNNLTYGLILLVGIFASCSSQKTVPTQRRVVPPQEPRISPRTEKSEGKPKPSIKNNYIDYNYAKMSDLYYIDRGMDYTKVKNLLKVDPVEVLMNVADNCLIAIYNVKNNYRTHELYPGNKPPIVPLNNSLSSSNFSHVVKFYASNSTSNLTYLVNEEASKVYIIFDGELKTVRSYFFESDQEVVDQYNQIISRAVKACEDPSTVNDFLYEIAEQRFTREKAMGENAIQNNKSLIAELEEKKKRLQTVITENEKIISNQEDKIKAMPPLEGNASLGPIKPSNNQSNSLKKITPPAPRKNAAGLILIGLAVIIGPIYLISSILSL